MRMLSLAVSLSCVLVAALSVMPHPSQAFIIGTLKSEEAPPPKDVKAKWLATKKDSKMRVVVSLKDQAMHIWIDGRLARKWTISTGAEGFDTPPGHYRPERIYEDYYSKQYDLARMPHAVFFHRGYAIHGTYNIFTLGVPASHGCIRLPRSQSKTFLKMVQERPRGNVSIEVRKGSI